MREYAVAGKPLPRVDGKDKVTGRTLYAADVKLPSMLHGRILRCPYAHALIKRIDVSRARSYPGVEAVVTAADLPNVEPDLATRSRCVFASREVVFAGQPVAAVVALDPHLAEEALALIEVEYQELPAVLDPLSAMEPGSSLVRGGSMEADWSEQQSHATINLDKESQTAMGGTNIALQVRFARGDVEEGFAEADVVLENTYRTSMVHQSYMEPQAAVAQYDISDQLTIWTTTQGQFGARSELAKLLGIPETNVRVIPTEVGGGFGGKTFFLQPMAAVLSRAVRRPVKVVMSRTEDLQAAIPAPQAIITVKLGARKDGTLTALKGRAVYDAGAFAGAPLYSGPLLLGGYYKFPNLEVEGYEVLTNKVGVGAYRAPSAPEVTFAIESHMDVMARELGMDPLDFRLKNAVEKGDQLPHGMPYPDIGLKECLLAIRESQLWKNRKRHPNRGYGLAAGGWPGGIQPASASVMLNGDGTFGVLVGAVDISGANTSLAQIAAEELGVPLAKIRISTGDTSVAPFSGASNGSKITYTVGRAVMEASRDARRQIREIAANELEIGVEDLELADGSVRARSNPDKSLPLARIGALTTAFGARYAPVLGRGSVAIKKQAPAFTAQLIAVEVDPETGQVAVLEAAAAQDVGFAINPLSVEGQIQGGLVQGLGVGLWEELSFDSRGQLMNPSFLDYRLPTSADVPEITPILVEVPSEEGPYGAKLVGEPPIIPTSAALANAVYDAVGVRLRQLPLTPERVLRALQEAKGPAPTAVVERVPA